MSINIVSHLKGHEFDIPYVVYYKTIIATPKTALAKMYEEKNEMLLKLKIPKTSYKEPFVQELLNWGNTNVREESYYRDIAVHVEVMGGFEQTVVFTHASIVTRVEADTEEDMVTIFVTANQKRDKFAGVMFGDTLEETYQKAWERVNNPPRMNIVIPIVNKQAVTIEDPTVPKVEYVSYVKNKKKIAKFITEKVRNISEGKVNLEHYEDFVAEFSNDRKTFIDGKNIEYTIENLLSEGYRYDFMEEKEQIYNYKRKLINIYVDINSKKDSFVDGGYINEKDEYCVIRPMDILRALGYKALIDYRGNISTDFIRVKLEGDRSSALDFTRIKTVENGNTYTLDNINLMDIKMKLNVKLNDNIDMIRSATFTIMDKIIATLDSKGLNMIANMERNKAEIIYDAKTGKILSIPTILPDVGYGHDINERPMNPVPKSLNANESLELLKKDVAEFEEAIATGIKVNFTQDQFNALVSLRYNVGYLGEINNLLEYLELGLYDRIELKNIINAHYDAIIEHNPKKEIYRQGWYNRTEKFLNIFFDSNYGDMPIDAVNGMVNI